LISARVITEESQHLTTDQELMRKKKSITLQVKHVTFIFQRTENKINLPAELYLSLKIASDPNVY